jgi:regulator of cell morphogenesis and NO signaling
MNPMTLETMDPIDGAMLVNDAVRRWPDTLRIFAEIGVDTCCGGVKPIAEAARRHGADPEALLSRLNAVARAAP